MQFLRTPDERFINLDGYPFEPHYLDVPDTEGGSLRMHYLDEGPANGEPILCLHGQPSWSYLYRHMLPIFTAAGCRVIAPDLIGFGRSDKPSQRSDYTYENHVTWLRSLLEQLNLSGLTMVCQDWGGLIGLRTAAENPDRFARIVTANTGLPDASGVADDQISTLSDRMRAYYADLPVHPDGPSMAMAMAGDKTGMGFLNWVKFCAESAGFKPGELISMSCGGLSEAQTRAYAAPFPDSTYMAGAQQFPSLVPIIPDNPAIPANRAAWKILEAWQKPVLTAFSNNDLVTAGGEVRFRTTVPGARGQNHITIDGGGHFLQETKGAELAAVVLNFIEANPA